MAGLFWTGNWTLQKGLHVVCIWLRQEARAGGMEALGERSPCHCRTPTTTIQRKEFYPKHWCDFICFWGEGRQDPTWDNSNPGDRRINKEPYQTGDKHRRIFDTPQLVSKTWAGNKPDMAAENLPHSNIFYRRTEMHCCSSGKRLQSFYFFLISCCISGRNWG